VSAALERTVTPEQVKDIGRCQKLLPTEADFKGRKGYWRRAKMVEDESGKIVPDPSGRYDWGFKFRPNVNGKFTSTGGEVLERMRPFMRADTERQQKNVSKQASPALLRDANGAVRPVAPGLADQAARRNGWTHVWSVSRNGRVESGVGGMLFRVGRFGWEATGRLQLGLSGKIAPLRLPQYDPDGNPWRWIAGSWRKVV